jgi:fructose-bisphosphate aldolase class 1
MTDCLNEQGIVPGIKVDKGLVPLANSNGESWCMGLDGLDKRCAEYYKAGARFAKWRSVVSIPAGPSMIALRDCAYGLARYAAIAQNAGLVPIVEPEVLLDGDQDIDRWGLTCSTRVVTDGRACVAAIVQIQCRDKHVCIIAYGTKLHAVSYYHCSAM